ncbi:ATP-binding cassette domain-containing protein [Ornithinibacillus halophilus]|uniref:ABC-2 type transport system ATP-binding protein n=1 Tax=Ornithinibacillus halophilus TaxID=930117 RepID=A0A1M5IVP5_9BACI|nr:ABC transporter ATP-binding protein [Ornithinibacillus halophilus]SHG32398.1 ABC-2 type transport system ATP-binding protein [Ornithinibacillus halophilus]
MMLKTLQVQNLSLKLNDKILLDDIQFELEQGTVTALVGHNGAGKSTLMKAILAVMEKTTGKIIINEQIDQDSEFLSFKQQISYLPEEPLLLTELTVMQHFQLYGKSYQIKEDVLNRKVDRLVKGFDLVDKLNEYPESLSKGMRQKVQTICAMLPDVPLMLIDEPFMGLDIYAIDYFEELLKEKLKDGTTLLLTTHQLDRVKDIAGFFILLQQGKLLSKGSIEEFDTIKRGTDNE